jgi:streptomycin 6-kinase
MPITLTSPDALVGRTLLDVLQHPGAVSSARAAGAELRRLHQQPLPAPSERDVRGPREEAVLLTSWLERMILQAPAAYSLLGERSRRSLAQLADLRTPRLRVVHGHLDAAQILLGDGDAVTIAEPASPLVGDPVIDLANLAAHLEADTDRTTARPLRRALLVGYGAPSRWGLRLAAYEEAARLRIACVDAVLMRAAAPPAATLPPAGRDRVRSMLPRQRGRALTLR